MNKSLTLHPKCLNKSLALLAKCLNKSLAAHTKCLNKSLVLHPKCFNKSLALYPKCLNKSLASQSKRLNKSLALFAKYLNKSLALHPTFWTKVLLHIQNVWTKVLLCLHNIWTIVLLCIQNILTNRIYNHLTNNKKHKIAWDDAVFIERESHFMRKKIMESIYINGLDPSEKHSNIMNLEKGVATNPCWNEFNSKVRKILCLWKVHADAISWEMSMYFHNDHWTFLCFWFLEKSLSMMIWVNIVLLLCSWKRHQLMLKQRENSMFVGN